MLDEVFLEFKFLKNRIIDLGNGSTYGPPYRMEPNTVMGESSPTPVYMLDKVHRVPLKSEKADVPDKEPGQSERDHQELVDEAYSVVRTNRAHNKDLLRRLNAFVESGSIEIVNNPFARKRGKSESETPPAKSDDKK